MIRRLPFLLALLVLAQTSLAPARCLARAAAPGDLALIICTADGLRAVHSDAPGQAPAHGEACLACHALPAVATTTPPTLSAPAWITIAAGWIATEASGWHPAIRGPPSGARAPPNPV